MNKVFFAGLLTDLQVFVGTVTQFSPETGNLCCLDVVVIATTQEEASTLVAMKYPDWDMQSLTCLSGMAFFNAIMLDPQCPQVFAMREFILHHIVAVPIDDDD